MQVMDADLEIRCDEAMPFEVVTEDEELVGYFQAVYANVVVLR
jgi:hypothetical protein